MQEARLSTKQSTFVSAACYGLSLTSIHNGIIQKSKSIPWKPASVGWDDVSNAATFWDGMTVRRNYLRPVNGTVSRHVQDVEARIPMVRSARFASHGHLGCRDSQETRETMNYFYEKVSVSV